MFSAHGSFAITKYENVIVVACAGAWNLETIQAYAKQATEIVTPLLDNPWAQITLISDWELATPDVEPVMAGIVHQATQRGLSCEAVVNANGLIKLEQFNRTLKVADKKFQREIFSSYAEASHWLNTEGFIAPSPDSVMQIGE